MVHSSAPAVLIGTFWGLGKKVVDQITITDVDIGC